MNKILLIGGTDPSGAGLQTDWQVAHHLGIQACSVVSAVTSQNKEAVFDQGILPQTQIKSQLDTLKNEHFSAIKIGMLGSETVIQAVVEFIQSQPPETTIILDPVLASSSGGELLNQQGRQSLLADLLPLVTLITPNINELKTLTNLAINKHHDIENAAQHLLTLGARNVLVKGGHFQTNNHNENQYSTDFFINHTDQFYLKGQRWQDRQNVRGSGCALATGIASISSQGYSLTDAVVYAKAFISQGIRNAIQVAEQTKLHFDTQTTEPPFKLIDIPKLIKNVADLNLDYAFASCNTKKLGIYPVVDSVDWLKKLVPLGITTLQLRIKDKQAEDLESDILEAIRYARENKIRLFINDYWQLAIKYQAYGIHLGQEDLDQVNLTAIAESGCCLGVSTHSYTEVARAHAINPSYLALGPIFETSSKIMPWIPQGVDAVKSWVNLLAEVYPLVAIGGINLERAIALKQTAVGSVAMISAITQAQDYKKATKTLLALWHSD